MIDPSPLFREGPSVRPHGRMPPSPSVFGRRIWLITFTDLVSLMLAFFVMLFAMSDVKVELWDGTAQSLSRTLDPSRSPPPPPPVAARNVDTVVRTPALDLDYLATLFHPISRGSPELVETRVARVPDGLILFLNPGDVFEGDGVGLSPAATRTLSAVGTILGNFSNRIGVRLRADPEVARQAGPGSAWEFALVRAAAIANALHAAGYDRDIAAYGLTDGELLLWGDPSGQIAGKRSLARAAAPHRGGRIEQIEILILADSVSRP
jgi:chemotaxis protein MotB